MKTKLKISSINREQNSTQEYVFLSFVHRHILINKQNTFESETH